MSKVSYNGKNYYEPELESLVALQSAGIYTFRYYPQDRMMIASDLFSNAFHCRKIMTDMPQSIASELIVEEDWEELFKIHDRILEGEKRVSGRLRSIRNHMCKITISVLSFDEEGKPVVAIGIVEDQDEDYRTEMLISALSRDFSSVYFVDFVKDQIIPYRMNQAIEEAYGEYFRTRPSYKKAIQLYINTTVEEEDRAGMLEATSYENMNRAFRGEEAFTHDFRGNRNGDRRYFRMKAVDLSSPSADRLERAIVGFCEISKEKQRELERYAYVDPVTGGDNYFRFKEKMVEADREGYLVSMDIHSFKIINSVCGIATGDETLKRVWNCIRDSLRDSGCAGHINADHFVLFVDSKNEEGVKDKLQNVSFRMADLSMEMDIPQLVPYYGVSKWNSSKSVEQAYSEATTAKHTIKERSDSQVAFYSTVDTTRILEEKGMEDAFEYAVANSQFESWFQPKYNPETGEVVGAEALVRWRRADGILIAPGAFIPLFERNGMIRILDEQIFRQVCKLQKERMENGKEMVPISINLSRASIYFQNLEERYHDITEEYGLDPKLVPIEITESAAVASLEVRELIERFHKKGFLLHMDDFGTGYSSLASLNVLHFDTLKVDKSLVDYIGNHSGECLLRHTIALAKELGMHVTAEGVEQKEQVEFLMQQNCDSIQGYYYSKPLPKDEFIKLLEKQNQNKEADGRKEKSWQA